MSCSLCVACKQMVPLYEKYCFMCVQKFGLKQVKNFHKHNNLPWEEYTKEFQKDLAEKKP